MLYRLGGKGTVMFIPQDLKRRLNLSTQQQAVLQERLGTRALGCDVTAEKEVLGWGLEQWKPG